MKLLCLTAIAFGAAATAAMPRFASERVSPASETAATQDAPAAALPPSGGSDALFPAASLLLGASILAYALFRRRRRI